MNLILLVPLKKHVNIHSTLLAFDYILGTMGNMAKRKAIRWKNGMIAQWPPQRNYGFDAQSISQKRNFDKSAS